MTRITAQRRTALAAGLLAAATGLFVVAGAPTAARALDREWPCQQQYVPEIAAATIWAGPPIDQARPAITPEIGSLADKLASLMTPDDQVTKLIDDFAAKGGQAGPQADQRLTAVFAATFDRINEARTKEMANIRRFTRGQITLASDLNAEMVKLDHMTHGQAPQEGTPAYDLQQSATVRQRIFDERERTIPYMCDQPLTLERRLGLVARAIANHMSS